MTPGLPAGRSTVPVRALLWPGLLLLVLCAGPSSPAANGGGLIHCRCNTWDCEDQQRDICSTTFPCYVQLEYSADGEDVLTYGCHTGNSIMCENRAPQHYPGHWPLMTCCSTNFCNKDVVLARPKAWDAEEAARPAAAAAADDPSPAPEPIHPANASAAAAPGPAPRQHQHGINPLYVAVPVVGALVLLALAVFAVYILRRPPASSTYKYHPTLTKDQYPAPAPGNSSEQPPPIYKVPVSAATRQQNGNGMIASPWHAQNARQQQCPVHHNANSSQQHAKQDAPPPPRHQDSGCYNAPSKDSRSTGSVLHAHSHNGPVAKVEPFSHTANGFSYAGDAERSSSGGSETGLILQS